MEFSLDTFLPYLLSLGKAILIFVAGWILSKWSNRLTFKALSRYDQALRLFLAGLIQYTVLAATVITSLAAVGIQTTSLLAVFASAGLAIGMALQGSLANFASGIMILIFKPFQLEQRVTAAGHSGTVKDIGLFATTLLTPAADTIIIPNRAVTSSAIINHTVKGEIRATISVGVAYGTKVEVVIPILMAAAKSAELVLAEPAPAVAFVGLGASSLDFDVRVWAKAADWGGMQHNVRTAVYNALNQANIEIPFNQLVVHKA